MKTKVEWVPVNDGFLAIRGGIIMKVLQSTSGSYWQWSMHHRVSHFEGERVYQNDPEWALRECENYLLTFARRVLRQLSKDIREREVDEAVLLHEFEGDLSKEDEDAKEKMG